MTPDQAPEDTAQERKAWGPARWALAVFALSLAIRGTWAALAHVTPISDFQGYDDLAVRWLQTGRFAESGSLAYRTPGYPAFLVAVYALAGHSWRAVGLAQAFLGAASSGLLVLLATRILSPRTSAIAGFLHAVSPTALAYVPLLASETLAAFLLIAALLVLAVAERQQLPPSRWLLAGSGLLFGLLVLVRPAAVFLLPAGIVLSVWRPRAVRLHPLGAFALVLAALLALSPWLVRNRLAGLGPTTISTVGGENLWMGNNDLATLGGFCQAAAWPQVMPEVEKDKAYRRAALRWIASHPARYLQLTAMRAYRLLGVEPDTWAATYLWPSRQNDLAFTARFRHTWAGDQSVAPALLVRAGEVETRNARLLRRVRIVLAALTLLGLVCALAWWRDYAIVLLPALCYIGGLSLTYVEVRFRELADPLLFIPLAGLLGVFIFRTTELAHEPLRPSLLVSLARTAVRTFTPQFQQSAAPTELLPSSLVALTEAARSQEAAGHVFSPVSLTDPAARCAAFWSGPTWQVSVTPAGDGVRCEVVGSSDPSLQLGGLSFRIPPARALRLELAFLHPGRLQAVHVDACDAAGQPIARWTWHVQAGAPPPRDRRSYLLLPGKQFGHFLPAGAGLPGGPPKGDPSSAVEVRITLQVSPGFRAGVVVYRAAIAR
jgi:4-amino-4-deoxy-L-arabinose transferase-like glycosyltransferase